MIYKICLTCTRPTLNVIIIIYRVAIATLSVKNIFITLRVAIALLFVIKLS